MSKSKKENDLLNLAIYVLNKRLNTVADLVKYWAIIGPCIEPHPSIEDLSEKR